jgi:hypothetical protein
VKRILIMFAGVFVLGSIIPPLAPARALTNERPHQKGGPDVEAAQAGRPCNGKRVRVGQDLARVAQNASAGTTFCLDAGTFVLGTSVALQAGDRMIGAGPRKTAVRPSGMGTPVVAFYASGQAGSRIRIARMDVGGFQSPPDADCQQCGSAVHSNMDTGGVLSLSRVRCHDNGTVCVSTLTGDIRATRLNCYANGFHAGSLLDATYRSASCIKMFGGSMTLRRSNIHDNDWNGVWCDHCDHTTWIVEDSVFEHNGHAAIQWEISGTLSTDTALVRDNTITGNGWQLTVQGSFTSAGVVITGGRNITVENNVFRSNGYASLDGSTLSCCRAVHVYDDDRAPWDPNLQNVSIVANDVGTDQVVGCELTGVTCSANA